MPSRPPRPCPVAGCPALVRHPDRYCPRHAAERADRERARLAARPSATQRGYGRAWQQARGEWLAAHPACVTCGSAATLVDHIVPKRFGGADDPSNYQSMCRRCHESKSRKEQRQVVPS